jgi:N-acetylneuraminic acid mutarotase
MRRLICWLLWMALAGWGWGQQAASNSSAVPTVIRFNGNLADENGKAMGGMVGVTFSLYKDERGGAPLWVETQNVASDKSGHYSVTLGSMTTQGLPQSIFASGEARWLGVQPQGQTERPRVLLMSVPYALKAADAETVGGLPPSAFVLAAPSTRASILITPGSPPVGGSGTMNYIPIWTDGTGDLGDSILYQTGSGNTAKVGLNTTTPVAALDIGNGDLSVSAGNLAINSGNLTMGSGNLNLAQTGGGNVGVIALGGAPFIQACCSASAGNTSVGNSAGGFNLGATHNTAEGYQALANSNAPDNTASGYQALVSNGQGKSNTAVGSGALLQNTTGNLNTAVGNGAGFTNSTAGSNNTLVGAGADVGTDGLTFAAAIGSNAIVNESNALVLGGTGANAVKVGIGTATPAATLDVQGTANFTGLITFAPGQTFGGTGTITGVNTPAGGGLTGGGTSGTLNLSLLNTCSTGQVLSWNGSAWVCTGLSGGGTITGVVAGTDLTGGGLTGTVTLNLDTTQVPQLGTANSFAATQTVNGLVAITGSGNGVQFPDGTLQTTAATGGGGIPSGFMILGSSSTAPPGYTLSGTVTSGNVASSVAPMLTARDQLAAATVSGKIYAIGGYASLLGLKVNEVYDPSTNSWSTKKPMPTGRKYFAAAATSNSKIVVMGGNSGFGHGIMDSVEEYDPSNDRWSAKTKLPVPTEGLAAATYLDALYAIGGYNGSQYLSLLERSTGGGWGRLKPMPSKRASLAAAVVNGNIYAIGGYDGRSVLDTVEVYDIQNNQWTTAAPMPTARRDLAAVVLNGKIYAIGGYDGKSSLNLVEVYDPSTQVWSTAPSPLAARTQFGAVALNGFVYLMGGIAGTTILGTVEQYSPPQTLYTFTKN